MSVNRDMKGYMLQIRPKTGRSPSGAVKAEWEDVEKIDVAVYKNSELITSASERYKESTHTGLTYYKELKSGKYRLKRNELIYSITNCDTAPRLTNLMLREVSMDV